MLNLTLRNKKMHSVFNIVSLHTVFTLYTNFSPLPIPNLVLTFIPSTNTICFS